MGVINQIMTMIELETSSKPDLSSTDLSNDLHCAKVIYFFIASVSGPHEKMENCGTCSLTDMKCPGHLGHIELPVPVYHPLWMRQLELVSISVTNQMSQALCIV